MIYIYTYTYIYKCICVFKLYISIYIYIYIDICEVPTGAFQEIVATTMSQLAQHVPRKACVGSLPVAAEFRAMSSRGFRRETNMQDGAPGS